MYQADISAKPTSHTALSEAYSRSDGLGSTQLGSTSPAIWRAWAQAGITGPSITAGAQQLMRLHYRAVYMPICETETPYSVMNTRGPRGWIRHPQDQAIEFPTLPWVYSSPRVSSVRRALRTSAIALESDIRKTTSSYSVE